LVIVAAGGAVSVVAGFSGSDVQAIIRTGSAASAQYVNAFINPLLCAYDE
jgi:hypothetical protein